MNAYTITFQTVLDALHRQWKRILVSILLFALLGGAAGFLFRGRGAAEAGGGAQPLNQVDFAQVARTQDYYTGCLRLLTDTMSNLNNYIASVSANALPTAAQEVEPQEAEALETLKALSREVAVLQSDRLTPLSGALNGVGAVYAPDEYLDNLADRYARDLASIRMDLISAEAAMETLRQMDAPQYDGSHSDSYTTLLSQAAQYGSLLRSQAVTEEQLEKLTNHMPEIRAECRRVERELEAARGELNAILDRFDTLADKLAREAGLTFTPAATSEKMDITVTHSHRASSAGESFAVTMVFCVLVGLCLGIFLAVCREAKEEKKRLSSSAEKMDAVP